MARSGLFGTPADWPDQDLIAFSAEFDEVLVLEAYACGVFPMPIGNARRAEMGWWSPQRRGVLPLDAERVPRSLRKSAKRYATTIDAAFDEVLARCADPRRPYSGSTPTSADLHRAAAQRQGAFGGGLGRIRRLVGGLYGS